MGSHCPRFADVQTQQRRSTCAAEDDDDDMMETSSSQRDAGDKPMCSSSSESSQISIALFCEEELDFDMPEPAEDNDFFISPLAFVLDVTEPASIGQNSYWPEPCPNFEQADEMSYQPYNFSQMKKTVEETVDPITNPMSCQGPRESKSQPTAEVFLIDKNKPTAAEDFEESEVQLVDGMGIATTKQSLELAYLIQSWPGEASLLDLFCQEIELPSLLLLQRV